MSKKQSAGQWLNRWGLVVTRLKSYLGGGLCLLASRLASLNRRVSHALPGVPLELGEVTA